MARALDFFLPGEEKQLLTRTGLSQQFHQPSPTTDLLLGLCRPRQSMGGCTHCDSSSHVAAAAGADQCLLQSSAAEPARESRSSPHTSAHVPDRQALTAEAAAGTAARAPAPSSLRACLKVCFKKGTGAAVLRGVPTRPRSSSAPLLGTEKTPAERIFCSRERLKAHALNLYYKCSYHWLYVVPGN